MDSHKWRSPGSGIESATEQHLSRHLMVQHGCEMVRYADDFVVLCR